MGASRFGPAPAGHTPGGSFAAGRDCAGGGGVGSKVACAGGAAAAACRRGSVEVGKEVYTLSRGGVAGGRAGDGGACGWRVALGTALPGFGICDGRRVGSRVPGFASALAAARRSCVDMPLTVRSVGIFDVPAPAIKLPLCAAIH